MPVKPKSMQSERSFGFATSDKTSRKLAAATRPKSREAEQSNEAEREQSKGATRWT